MSDETTRPDDEDEVEAHGPDGRGRGQGRRPGPSGLSPEAEANDDEPDVEAHGPAGLGPSAEGRRARAQPARAVGPVARGPRRKVREARELPGLSHYAPSVRASGSRSRRPASRCSSSSASTAAARRATTSSSPPPSPRSRSASRALSSRSTAIAAWLAKRPEELHLLEAEERLLGPVEHREHAERALLVQKRSGHEPLRDVARVLGDVVREARIVLDVLDDERRSRREDPAGDPRAGGEARAEERVLALADDRLEDELLGLLVEEEDRRRLGAEDRPRDLDDRREQCAERLLGSDDACGDGRAKVRLVGHVPPPTFVAVR